MHVPFMIAVFLLNPLALFTGMASDESNTGVEKLSWMGGCWAGSNAGRNYTEQWMSPGGQTMLGMSRTIKDGKTVQYEFLMLKQDGNGDVYYVANPSKQASAEFKLNKLNNNEATFENPEHDFPQRIIYRLESDGGLFARIEGKMNGSDRGFDYPMKKVKCD